jgi:hypothetical protein
LRRLGLALATAALACATPQTDAVLRAAPPLPARVDPEVPFHAQEAHQCGPAALAMALAASGDPVTPESLVAEVFVPERKGTLAVGILGAARAHGRVPYPVSDLDTLLRELTAGHPVLVLQDLGLRPFTVHHFALAVGYDLPERVLRLHSGRTPRRTTPLATFERTWKRARSFAVVVLPPGELPVAPDEARWLAEAAGLERAGRYAEAEVAYRAATARWPGSGVAWLGLGNALLAGDRDDQAEAALREATARTPGSAAAWNNLAHVLLRRGRLGEARDAAQRAVALGGPQERTARETLAEIERAAAP